METKIEDFIGVYEDAFTPEYCQSVIDGFEQLSAHGFIQSRQELGDGDTTVKNDDAIWSGNLLSKDQDAPTNKMSDAIGGRFQDVFWNALYPPYAQKYAVLKESDKHYIYENKVQRTGVGQGYHIWHYESSSVGFTRRLLTYILYLNDVEEGGETEFLYLHKRIKPKAGTFVLFPAAFTHTHRGNPPLSNTKYVVTGWVEF